MSELFAAGEAAALLDATIRGELPDERGRFGPFGGRYVPETLVPAFERLEDGVREYLHAPSFQDAFQKELREWVGRPTALTFAPKLSEEWGAEVWIKREDLAHTPLGAVLGEFEGKGFAEFKKSLTDLAVAKLGPMGSEMKRYLADPAEVDAILCRGAERARTLAQPVIEEVKRTVGFLGA